MSLSHMIDEGHSGLVDSEEWICELCTFHNIAGILVCEVCNTRRELENHKPASTTKAMEDIEYVECGWCSTKITIYEEVCPNCDKSVFESRSPLTIKKEIGKEPCGMTKEPLPKMDFYDGPAEKIDDKVTLKYSINPQKQVIGKKEIDDRMEYMQDLFPKEIIVEEETEEKKIEEKAELLDDISCVDVPIEIPKPIKELEEEGFGIGFLYRQEPIKASKFAVKHDEKLPTMKEEPKHEEDIFLICDKCSYRNNIEHIVCYMCSHHLLESISEEPSVKGPLLIAQLPSGVCKMCSYENPPKAKVCEVCTYNLSHQKMLLNCPHCTMENHVTSVTCIACEKALPETEYNKKLFEECPICMGILDIALLDQHVKDCKESQKILEELKNEEESLNLQEKCPYCNIPFYRLDFEEHIRKCHNHEDYYKQTAIFGSLSPLQVSCIKFMHENSHKQHFSAKLPLQRRLEKMGYKAQDLDGLYQYIYKRVPLIIHIHITKHMEFFVKDTHYRNQFETGKSSGSTNLVSRKSWQTRMFMNKYDASPHFERVKYGTVNFTNDPRGVDSCRSYGNSYLVLKKSVRDRCTVTDQDSSNSCSLIGTFKFSYHILNKLSDAELKATVRASKGEEVSSSVISTYKEIQIHGPIEFASDIEKMYVNEIEYTTPQLKALVEQFSKSFGIPYQVFK